MAAMDESLKKSEPKPKDITPAAHAVIHAVIVVLGELEALEDNTERKRVLDAVATFFGFLE